MFIGSLPWFNRILDGSDRAHGAPDRGPPTSGGTPYLRTHPAQTHTPQSQLRPATRHRRNQTTPQPSRDRIGRPGSMVRPHAARRSRHRSPIEPGPSPRRPMPGRHPINGRRLRIVRGVRGGKRDAERVRRCRRARCRATAAWSTSDSVPSLGPTKLNKLNAAHLPMLEAPGDAPGPGPRHRLVEQRAFDSEQTGRLGRSRRGPRLPPGDERGGVGGGSRRGWHYGGADAGGGSSVGTPHPPPCRKDVRHAECGRFESDRRCVVRSGARRRVR